MRFPLLALAALLVAGCAGDAEPPAADDDGGPPRLASQPGLLLFDRETGLSQALTLSPGLAWISPSGRYVLWDEPSYQILLDATTGSRVIAPSGAFVRIYDNGTGLHVESGRADIVDLATREVLATRGLPAGAWDQASDDLRVLAASTPGAGACSDSLVVLREDETQNATGCHLRVSSDGRVAWREGLGLRIVERDGEARELAPPQAAAGQTVGFENPVLTTDGEVYLRVTGAERVTTTDVVAGNATILRMDGPNRLAIHDASADGRLLLLRVFER